MKMPTPDSPARAAPPASSPLLRPERVPFRPLSTLGSLGRTLVVAPHPDDESLGCGGLLALLGRRGQPARVLFVTGGTGSHPHSREYPPPRLRALREREALQALRRLGLLPKQALFLGLPDCHVPTPGTPGFRAACRRFLMRFQPQTLVLPWRRDPHGDHRATGPEQAGGRPPAPAPAASSGVPRLGVGAPRPGRSSPPRRCPPLAS